MNKILDFYAKERHLILLITISLAVGLALYYLNEYAYCRNMAILIDAEHHFTLRGCLVRPPGVEQWVPLELLQYQIPLQ